MNGRHCTAGIRSCTSAFWSPWNERMGDIIDPYLTQLLSRSPSILACVIGLILTLVLWKRCPRAAILVFLALGMFLFTSIVLPLVHLYLIFHAERPFALITLFTFLWSMINAGSIVLLVIAAFTSRSHPVLRHYMEDDDDYPPITNR